MTQFLSTFNWIDFLPIAGLWLITVLVAIAVLAKATLDRNRRRLRWLRSLNIGLDPIS